jgi:hypothetical protein
MGVAGVGSLRLTLLDVFTSALCGVRVPKLARALEAPISFFARGMIGTRVGTGTFLLVSTIKSVTSVDIPSVAFTLKPWVAKNVCTTRVTATRLILRALVDVDAFVVGCV